MYGGMISYNSPEDDIDWRNECTACHGSGEGFYDSSICQVCKGSGSQPNANDLKIEEEKQAAIEMTWEYDNE